MQPKVNILFIEDERNILTFVRKLLYGHNYKVTTAITGTEGLQLINSICPDLILLDLGLPDMDGQTIIRQVREWSDCPIIVISARTNEHEKVKALDLGADDYITKPFGSAELLARIRTSLRHNKKRLLSHDTNVSWDKSLLLLRYHPNWRTKTSTLSCANTHAHMITAGIPSAILSLRI